MTAWLAGCGGSGADDSLVDAPPESAPAATSTTAEPGPPPGSELVGIRDLEVNDCFDTVSNVNSTDRAVWKLNCGDPHTYEVFDVIAYDADGSGRGLPYPGVPTVQNWSEQSCYAQFEPFVGVRWTISELDIKVWWPSNTSWDLNDRQVVCTVMSTNGAQLTGTQRGAKR